MPITIKSAALLSAPNSKRGSTSLPLVHTLLKTYNSCRRRVALPVEIFSASFGYMSQNARYTVPNEPCPMCSHVTIYKMTSPASPALSILSLLLKLFELTLTKLLTLLLLILLELFVLLLSCILYISYSLLRDVWAGKRSTTFCTRSPS